MVLVDQHDVVRRPQLCAHLRISGQRGRGAHQLAVIQDTAQLKDVEILLAERGRGGPVPATLDAREVGEVDRVEPELADARQQPADLLDESAVDMARPMPSAITNGMKPMPARNAL